MSAGCAGILGARRRDLRRLALIARGRAPVARHLDGAAVGGDEAGYVDGVGQRVLAQAVGCGLAADARAAGIPGRIAQARDGRAERLLRGRLQRLLHPGVQADHHGAVDHRPAG